jgi:hypothetical protein
MLKFPDPGLLGTLLIMLAVLLAPLSVKPTWLWLKKIVKNGRARSSSVENIEV